MRRVKGAAQKRQEASPCVAGATVKFLFNMIMIDIGATTMGPWSGGGGSDPVLIEARTEENLCQGVVSGVVET